MRWALSVPNFGPWADPRLVMSLAVDAEDAGWDALFMWDHLLGLPGAPVADPWTVLTSIAQVTERIRVGPMVTPLPRRRPWEVARQAVTLDHLSGGRLTLGVGLGHRPEEARAFGDPVDESERGRILDEALDVVTGLWTGAPFSFHEAHFTVDDVTFLPRPVQRPRIPIWVAATRQRRAPLLRAARYDGVVPIGDPNGDPFLSLEQLASVVATVRRLRADPDAPFDIVYPQTPPDDPAASRDAVQTASEIGVTWWQVGPGWGEDAESFRTRISRGTPEALLGSRASRVSVVGAGSTSARRF